MQSVTQHHAQHAHICTENWHCTEKDKQTQDSNLHV